MLLNILQIRKMYLKNTYRQFSISIWKQAYCYWNGFLPESYILYQFEKCNPKNFISDFKRLRYGGYLNGKHAILLDDKWLFYQFFKDKISVSQPEFIIMDRGLITANNQICSLDNIPDLLKENQEYILKPNGGGGGYGILFFSLKSGLFEIGHKGIFNLNEFTSLIASKNYLCYKKN